MGARCVKIIIDKLSNSWKMTDPKGNLQLHPHLEARVVAQIELTGGLRTSNRVTRVYAISGTACASNFFFGGFPQELLGIL